MKKLEVKSISRPSRCEICHQVDCFDALTNSCSRCSIFSPQNRFPRPYTPIRWQPLDRISAMAGFITGTCSWVLITAQSLYPHWGRNWVDNSITLLGGLFLGLHCLFIALFLANLICHSINIFHVTSHKIIQVISLLFTVLLSLSVGGLMGLCSVLFLGKASIYGQLEGVFWGLVVGAIMGSMMNLFTYRRIYQTLRREIDI